MPSETMREQRKMRSEPGPSPFVAQRELEIKLTNTMPALEELHANSRALFRRERTASEGGMFRLRPRNPEDV